MTFGAELSHEAEEIFAAQRIHNAQERLMLGFGGGELRGYGRSIGRDHGALGYLQLAGLGLDIGAGRLDRA